MLENDPCPEKPEEFTGMRRVYYAEPKLDSRVTDISEVFTEEEANEYWRNFFDENKTSDKVADYRLFLPAELQKIWRAGDCRVQYRDAVAYAKLPVIAWPNKCQAAQGWNINSLGLAVKLNNAEQRLIFAHKCP